MILSCLISFWCLWRWYCLLWVQFSPKIDRSPLKVEEMIVDYGARYKDVLQVQRLWMRNWLYDWSAPKQMFTFWMSTAKTRYPRSFRVTSGNACFLEHRPTYSLDDRLWLRWIISQQPTLGLTNPTLSTAGSKTYSKHADKSHACCLSLGKVQALPSRASCRGTSRMVNALGLFSSH